MSLTDLAVFPSHNFNDKHECNKDNYEPDYSNEQWKVNWHSPNHHSQSINQSTEYSRNLKGYLFEMECKEKIGNTPNINYLGNPSCFSDWLQNHNKNSFDATITYPNGTSEKLELKSVSNGIKIYHSWFERDWLTRDAKIIVTNNPTSINYRDKRIAEKQGKKILSVSENEVRMGKKVHNMLHPNKYSYLNRLIFKISNINHELASFIRSGRASLRLKIRLKGSLLRIKSIVPKCFKLSNIVATSTPMKNDDFTFSGKQISNDKLEIIWQAINQASDKNKPMPKIDAVLMDKAEFIRVMDAFHNTGVKMEGLLWEYGYPLPSNQIAGVNFHIDILKGDADDKFYVLISDDVDERKCLIHELLHIYNEDWLKFSSVYRKCKEMD